MRLRLGYAATPSPRDAFVRRAAAWEAPSLVGTQEPAVRRWAHIPTWMPPETEVLARHRAVDRPHWIMSNRRDAPEGYELEFDLGVIHRFALPGTLRLIRVGGTYELTTREGPLEPDEAGLGFVEQAPLVMLDVLELRRSPDTGQPVLVAGVDDPLYDVAEPVSALGWIEAFPIQPKRAIDRSGIWGLTPLWRLTDHSSWRHRYGVGEDRPAGTVCLGSLWHSGGPGFVALHETADGRLTTELLPQERRPAGRPQVAARWIAAPLGWSKPPPSWAVRATASRARHLVRRGVSSRPQSTPSPEPLGWLGRTRWPGWSPLFSAEHPVLGDQFLTRSELEARDMGYRVTGVLGYVNNAGADHGPEHQPKEILWASRFGRRRRFVEGPVVS